MRQMIGKKIDTYYNIRYNMQNNNYHTYDKNNNKKSKDNMIIEGLDNKEKIDIVSSNYKSFNGVYADYLKCSAPNNIACAKLQTEYDTQTTKVNNLENEYNKQDKIHTDCTNLKARCEVINDSINNTQAIIDGINTKGRAQHNLLQSFQNTSIESGRDFLNKNNVDMCDKNIDYSNKIDNLIDLKKTYNTNKENIQKKLTFKENDIYNNSISISDSNNKIAAYTAKKNTYDLNKTSNYNEANKLRQICHRSCSWFRCKTHCRHVPKHSAHWKHHYNLQGDRWKTLADGEQKKIDAENRRKQNFVNARTKNTNEKIQLENDIRSINTDITNKTNMMTNLKNDCSREQLNALEKLRSEMEANLKSKRDTEVEYKDICNSKQISCDKEYAVFQPIEQNYNNEKLAQADLKNRHEICVDPLRNDCKDLYNEYRNYNKNTQIATTLVEKYQNYSDLDDTAPHAPQVHEKIKSNYKKVQDDFNKLKTKEQEMNIKLNKNSSVYESPIDKHDKEIYTNLLLTAFATSLLYVVFVEM